MTRLEKVLARFINHHLCNKSTVTWLHANDVRHLSSGSAITNSLNKIEVTLSQMCVLRHLLRFYICRKCVFAADRMKTPTPRMNACGPDLRDRQALCLPMFQELAVSPQTCNKQWRLSLPCIFCRRSAAKLQIPETSVGVAFGERAYRGARPACKLFYFIFGLQRNGRFPPSAGRRFEV